MSSPFCTRQDNKIAPRGVGVSLSGATLLAEASLRGAKLSGTSLSEIVMRAGSSLYGASLGGTLGLADASLRGALLRDTLLLAGALLRGVSLAESAANGTKEFLLSVQGGLVPSKSSFN
jgi:uncharacterized protein YjbI with pentapeptide repeats